MIVKKIKRILVGGALFVSRLKHSWFIKELRRRGISIGENFVIQGSAFGTYIDVTRPSLITIGNNVMINHRFSLVTHDFVTGVFKAKYDDFLPSSGKVTIGNNVMFGINCTVLKGVTIGDNCFIAAGALVTKDIPSNSIAGGVPAKVICTIDEYYSRRKEECIGEAFLYAWSIVERFHRRPVPADFTEEFTLFVDKKNVEDYQTIPIKRQLGIHYDEWIKNHKAQFDGFEEFITASGVDELCSKLGVTS